MMETGEPAVEQSESIGGLPMLVWLRGDEPHFSDFSLNADQVMERLGIRRSRLNQISGKELRVGRARIDGYVRPVYRPDDIEEYLQWIRPSASHKKSSDVLDEARSKLESQSERILDEFSHRFDGLVETFTSKFQQRFSDEHRFSKRMFVTMHKTLRLSLRGLSQRMGLMHEQSLKFWQNLDQRLESLDTLVDSSELTKTALLQTSDRVLHSEKILLRLQNEQKDLLQKVSELAQALEDLKDKSPKPNVFAPSPQVRHLHREHRLRRRKDLNSIFDLVEKPQEIKCLARIKKAKRNS